MLSRPNSQTSLISRDDIEANGPMTVSANVDPALPRTEQLLRRWPKINAAYEKLNKNPIAKVGWGLFIAYGMALYNYLKESGQGDQAAAVASALVSLICNMLISYAYCLKAPFVAAAILAEMRENVMQALSVVAALAASGALTAQLINGQPLLWKMLVGLSAFANYLLTRTSGIVDNNNSAKNNALTVMVGTGVLFPLVSIWVADIQKLLNTPTIPDMVSNHLSIKSYIAGSAAATFGAIGSLITVLFYCQAIKSIPKKIQSLYQGWRHFIGNNLGFDPDSMKVKVISGLLTTITAGLLGYTGYYSMAGFNVAVLTALQCMPHSGELCWLTNLLGLSSALIDFLANAQQWITGLVNTSALIPAFEKFLKLLTVTINSNQQVPAITADSTESQVPQDASHDDTIASPQIVVISENNSPPEGTTPVNTNENHVPRLEGVAFDKSSDTGVLPKANGSINSLPSNAFSFLQTDQKSYGTFEQTYSKSAP